MGQRREPVVLKWKFGATGDVWRLKPDVFHPGLVIGFVGGGACRLNVTGKAKTWNVWLDPIIAARSYVIREGVRRQRN